MKVIVDDYVEVGIKKIEAHQMFPSLPPDALKDIILKAMGRDAEGFLSKRSISHDSKKWVGYVQEHMFTYDHKIRHALADNVLFEVFGMKKGLESCSLWEKINMMALLAERAGIAPTPFCDLMKKRAKVVSSMLSHASYLKSQDVNLIPQIDLQMTRMKDLLLAPTRWMDFITSSSEQGGATKI